jgi:3-oxoacyl-[acyl-carrier-protein] synthase II
MTAALADAELSPEDVGYVNAHGTSTPINDRVETMALRKLFADDGPPVSSCKGAVGHTLGAAGAIEAIITIQTIRESCVPPTINFDDPDDEAVGLDIVTGQARSQDVEIALSNSFGFGGQNTALIFRRWVE